MFEAAEAASAEDPAVPPGLGWEGRPSPMCLVAAGEPEDGTTINVERFIIRSIFAHREAIRNCRSLVRATQTKCAFCRETGGGSE